MSIAKVKLDESTKLEFGVSITGASGIPSSRLIIEGKDFAVSYPCRQTSNGVEADVTGLKNVFSAGEYPVRLEIVIENKIYTPFQDTIVFEPGVEITSQPKAKTAVNETVIKVRKPTQTSLSDTQDKFKVAKALAEVAEYSTSANQTPQQIVEAVRNMAHKFSGSQSKSVQQMLKLADQLGMSSLS